MSCTGCGSSSCRGCKDITVELPEGRGIDTIADNGDGTWTITYSDSTTQIINTPGTVPNDPWVSLAYADMTAVNFTGTATYSAPSHGLPTINLEYKIIAEDTVIVKGVIVRAVDITGLTNSINQNFRFPAFSGSNWFAGTKLFVPTTQRVPISIYSNTTTDNIMQKGNAIISTASSQNLISIGETNLQLPNGTYTFNIHFEVTCEIV
jgi:hypothetical protein